MPSTDATPLSEYGISRDQSSDWQKMASLPPDEIEEAIARVCFADLYRVKDARFPEEMAFASGDRQIAMTHARRKLFTE